MDALHEIFRVLKNDGKIYIADWGLERNSTKIKILNFFKYFEALKNIGEHGRGLFPQYIVKAGFMNLVEVGNIKTKTGTLCYYQANK
jgi:ubiquinone/menaquinone biosynthesis C-methylase UbiE